MRRLVLWYIGAKKSGEDNEQAIEQLVEQADVLLEQLAQLQSKREEIKR